MSARNTKLFTVTGAALASSAMVNDPVVVLMVALYVSAVLMVIGGAAEYCWVFTRALVLAGQPAATAILLAAACSVASFEWLATVVVVVDDEDDFFGLLELVRNTIRRTTPAMTTTMTVLRICLRRFFALASAARRSSLAARWRALLSLGTARDPICPGGTCLAGGGPGHCPEGDWSEH